VKKKMSESQQNIVSSATDGDQQTDGSSTEGKMMTQAEYLKYKQGDSNAQNYYGFSREATKHPVVWDGKFHVDPNNVYIVPNRNASSVRNFYGFSNEPSVAPVVW
jgi:hypothetical protein